MKKQNKQSFKQCFMQCNYQEPPKTKSNKRTIATVLWWTLWLLIAATYGFGIGAATFKYSELFIPLLGFPAVLIVIVAIIGGLIWAAETRSENQ